ncbi:hypothetical protein ACRAWF_28255 [Streptomyces sp. L7]
MATDNAVPAGVRHDSDPLHHLHDRGRDNIPGRTARPGGVLDRPADPDPPVLHRFGITLTPSAVVVHNLRRRTIPWPDIQAVQPESLLGTTTIVLYEANGRRTRLRAPSTGFPARDRHFEEKFHTIGTWWLAHRGPDWTPFPPRPAWPTAPQAPDENPFAPPA